MTTPEVQPEIMQGLARYFASREQQRAEQVASVLGAMNPRERKLVREAAVMGYVRGTMAGAVDGRAGREAEIPHDRDILALVVSCCLSIPDLYPTFEQMERLAVRRAARGAATGEVTS